MEEINPQVDYAVSIGVQIIETMRVLNEVIKDQMDDPVISLLSLEDLREIAICGINQACQEGIR